MAENESTGINLLRMTWNCRSFVKDIATAVGLSVHEVHCLTQLYVEKPCCVRKLVGFLDLPSTSVSKLLRSLDKKGFIARSLDAEDRRMERVVLTDAGLRTIEKIMCIADDYAENLFKTMPVEQATLLKGCIHLLSSQCDMQAETVAGCRGGVKTVS